MLEFWLRNAYQPTRNPSRIDYNTRESDAGAPISEFATVLPLGSRLVRVAGLGRRSFESSRPEVVANVRTEVSARYAFFFL